MMLFVSEFGCALGLPAVVLSDLPKLQCRCCCIALIFRCTVPVPQRQCSAAFGRQGGTLGKRWPTRRSKKFTQTQMPTARSESELYSLLENRAQVQGDV